MSKGKKTGALLLAGLAAFAIYKLSKMTGEERSQLAGDIKDKGRKLWDNMNPKNIKNKFSEPVNNVYENSQS